MCSSDLIACVNVVYGALSAMSQKDLKYVVAYSSVSHMGIVMLGMATLTEQGINGSVFQMFAHGIMTGLFFALVGLDSQAQEVLSAFEEKMAGWAEIRECHMIRGGGDFLLQVVAKDKEQRDALTMAITATPHVSRVTTFETIRTSKNKPGVPVEVEGADEAKSD